VPLREADMEPFEIMVSESQERMLCVCEPGRLDDVLAVCARWEVHGTAIGEVTDTGAMRIYRGDELVGDMPVAALVDDCPVYELAPQRPGAPLYDPPAATLARGGSVRDALLALLAAPNLASRRPLFEQYDWIVQSRTVRRPEEADAAVLALPDGGGLGVSIDGNGRRVAADPYQGTIAAMLECAANLACVGAEPLGVTNNLNFGNPEKPHIAWQLSEAVRGLGDACRALGVPVTGGNVSLYNEGATGPIYPTPVIGMLGRLPDARRAGHLGFAREGDAIALAGWDAAPSLAAGELAKLWGEPLPDGLPAVDLGRAHDVLEAVREAVRAGGLSSCHDIAEGGFLVAVAECCLAGGVGATLDLGPSDDPWCHLFGERPVGFVVSGPREALDALASHVSLDVFGTVGGDALELTIAGETSRWALGELGDAHAALARFFP
jgi:phosphoribosylformylglycinamidine synthase subunit PurL